MGDLDTYSNCYVESVDDMHDLKPGDHIRTPMASYFSKASKESKRRKGNAATHHMLVSKPIDDKRVQVIHKGGKGKDTIKEEEVNYEPKDLEVMKYKSSHTGSAAVERARKKIGKGEKYSLLTNNCEHFVTGVRGGEKKSKQISKCVDGMAIGSIGGGLGGGALGAAAGAVVGAIVGSIVPVFGTALGAGIGAAAGASMGGGGGGQ